MLMIVLMTFLVVSGEIEARKTAKQCSVFIVHGNVVRKRGDKSAIHSHDMSRSMEYSCDIPEYGAEAYKSVISQSLEAVWNRRPYDR